MHQQTVVKDTQEIVSMSRKRKAIYLLLQINGSSVVHPMQLLRLSRVTRLSGSYRFDYNYPPTSSLLNNYSSNYDQLSSSKALSSTSHSALADLWLFCASITYPSIWMVKWRYLQCCTCLLESGNWRLLLEDIIIGLFSSATSLSSPRDTKGGGVAH